jgi:hypothetical protein
MRGAERRPPDRTGGPWRQLTLVATFLLTASPLFSLAATTLILPASFPLTSLALTAPAALALPTLALATLALATLALAALATLASLALAALALPALILAALVLLICHDHSPSCCHEQLFAQRL